MGILEFEDTEAKLETVCFPKLWQKVKPLLQVGKAYTFSGNVKNDGRLSLLLEEIQPSEEWGRERSPWVRVEITQVDGEEGFFRALARELKGHAGSAPLLVHVEDQGSRVVLHPRSLKVCDTPALRSRLEELFPGRVRVGA